MVLGWTPRDMEWCPKSSKGSGSIWDRDNLLFQDRRNYGLLHFSRVHVVRARALKREKYFFFDSAIRVQNLVTLHFRRFQTQYRNQDSIYCKVGKQENQNQDVFLPHAETELIDFSCPEIQSFKKDALTLRTEGQGHPILRTRING